MFLIIIHYMVINFHIRLRYIIIFFGFFALAEIFFWCWFIIIKPEYDLRNLLNGSKDIEINKIIIKGQGKCLIIDSPEITTYLSKAFRTAKKGFGKSGAIAYQADIIIKYGGTVQIGLYVEKDGRSFSFYPPFGIFGEPEFFYLELTEPIPPSLFLILKELKFQAQSINTHGVVVHRI